MRLLILNNAKNSKKNINLQKPTIFDILSLNKNCEKNHKCFSPKKMINTKTEHCDKISIKRLLFKKDNTITRNSPTTGKLFNFINSSIYKQSLGSIPTKTENILLTSKIPTNRFEGPNSIYSKIDQNNPGVGDYNVLSDTKAINTILDYSDENRFNNININVNPGVGEYDLERGEEIFKSRNNFRYSNLYNKTRKLFYNNSIEKINNKSFNKNSISNDTINDNTINNNTINNNSLNNSINSDKNYSVYQSPTNKNNKIIHIKGRKIYPYSYKRDTFRKLPEIQKTYFQNNNIKINNNKTINTFNNIYYQSRNNHQKYHRTYKTIESNNENNAINTETNQRYNKSENKVYTFEDIYKMYKSENKKINKTEELEKKLKENKYFNYSKKLTFSIKQDRELEKIKTILGNDNGRRDIFNLSPSRWKENKYKMKVPGPAYYFNS